ncbi:hypothetical protein KBC75_02020 [Candidatus Shapirobacteria bacterium]|nr:hypothetical protein [Candidatus Shapirobacteria bacterium]
MLNISYQEANWYFCLAGMEPRIIFPDVPAENRNLNLADPVVLRAVLNCKKRTLMDGVYFKNGCAGCVCRERVDLEKLS